MASANQKRPRPGERGAALRDQRVSERFRFCGAGRRPNPPLGGFGRIGCCGPSGGFPIFRLLRKAQRAQAAGLGGFCLPTFSIQRVRFRFACDRLHVRVRPFICVRAAPRLLGVPRCLDRPQLLPGALNPGFAHDLCRVSPRRCRPGLRFIEGLSKRFDGLPLLVRAHFPLPAMPASGCASSPFCRRGSGTSVAGVGSTGRCASDHFLKPFVRLSAREMRIFLP